MLNLKQIPHLIRLWEDDSPVVREQVYQALISYGGKLESLLTPFWQDIPADQVKTIKSICRQLIESEFREKWNAWLEKKEGEKTLEEGLSLLAFLEEGYVLPSFEERIDHLNARFNESGQARNRTGLLTFLYKQEGYGAPKTTPFHPHNSHPIQALKTKEAFPIGLTCLGLLLADRAGISLHGFQLPGIFFLMNYHERGINLYDPFQRGNLVDAHMSRFHFESFRRIHGTKRELHANTQEILLEVINQMVTGYSRDANLEKVTFYSDLYNELSEKVHFVLPNSDSAG